MHEVLHIWYLSGDKNDAHNLIEIHPRDHAFPACAPRIASGFVRLFLTLRRLQPIVFHCELGRRHKTPIKIPQDSLFRFSPSRKSRSEYKKIHSSDFPQAGDTKSAGRPGGPIQWTKVDLTKWRLVKSQPSRLQPRRNIPSRVTTKYAGAGETKADICGTKHGKICARAGKTKLARLAKPSRHRPCTSVSSNRVIKKLMRELVCERLRPPAWPQGV